MQASVANGVAPAIGPSQRCRSVVRCQEILWIVKSVAFLVAPDGLPRE
jgi:hypothetical protein